MKVLLFGLAGEGAGDGSGAGLVEDGEDAAGARFGPVMRSSAPFKADGAADGELVVAGTDGAIVDDDLIGGGAGLGEIRGGARRALRGKDGGIGGDAAGDTAGQSANGPR